MRVTQGILTARIMGPLQHVEPAVVFSTNPDALRPHGASVRPDRVPLHDRVRKHLPQTPIYIIA
ncbi:uncharacterized protein STEHIDRAFT_147178 [Stereum hirsutum FP-91666 SS1]|uniref:uncharacterized protein n=1 Tax=Stereum hirsutum (strain FP-91666) TaxID=721885 RepID=UPI000440DFBC|nr:uncharacterized protein STEHIDRAFT_147178 [Stereum hirsutum FP-91666 SS1]EIM86647.1 hypothetical protein STEHIDRAFT_147178 [Stereum hirsutum FP-91666 SS1]